MPCRSTIGTRVGACIFHHFHHGWIVEIARALNCGILPADYYALAEQHAAGYGPDVLTLRGDRNGDADEVAGTVPMSSGSGVLLAASKLQPTAETDLAFYRRKQSAITVRHVSGDDLVAMVEVLSPGNKASRNSLRAFVDKAANLLEKQIHLLLLDVLPPGAATRRGFTQQFGRRSRAKNMSPRRTSRWLWLPTRADSRYAPTWCSWQWVTC